MFCYVLMVTTNTEVLCVFMLLNDAVF